MGETEIVSPGVRSATDWFALFAESRFEGMCMLGILNIVYNLAMVPVYFAVFAAHIRTRALYAGLTMTVAFLGMAIYISNNAALPMAVLADRYAAAGTDAERAAVFAAAEAVLARGEDFTLGTFTGTVLASIGAVLLSAVMLRGGVFGTRTAWAGIVGFTSISIFTAWWTFVPALHEVAFYGFGMLGGLFAMAWFVLVALKLFQLGQTERRPVSRHANITDIVQRRRTGGTRS
jgi:hypothetical protein